VSRPALHALLNGTAALLLSAGWLAIRGRGPWSAGRSVAAHKRLMLSAFGVSTLFLVSYLDYHRRVGSVAFWGTGWLRALYLAVLVPAGDQLMLLKNFLFIKLKMFITLKNIIQQPPLRF
jgi:uncharacterized membrane protein YozB (DUF420 family)